MGNNEDELIEVEDNSLNELDNFFSLIFDLTQVAYEEVINSAFFNTIIDTVKTVDDTCENISKIYKGIKLVASIPDRLFLRKFERLCVGVGKIA